MKTDPTSSDGELKSERRRIIQKSCHAFSKPLILYISDGERLCLPPRLIDDKCEGKLSRIVSEKCRKIIVLDHRIVVTFRWSFEK
jgi:hypothetical protein